MGVPMMRAGFVAALGLLAVACGGEREAEATTGTASAEVTTSAPENVISDVELQQQAQEAATAASPPVDGSAATMPTNPTPAAADAAAGAGASSQTTVTGSSASPAPAQ